MKILIAGAGAVGQVYGWHLRAAGHDVTFFVKEKYRAEVARGLVLHRLGAGAPRRQEWPQVSVVSSVADVAAQRFDQVWLTMSSDALRGDLAAQLLGAVGDATVVCLQPDLEDAVHASTKLPSPGQLVQGLITFISFQSPLPGTSGPEGIAYFLPPLTPTPFAGQRARVDAVVQALRAGGLPAQRVDDFAQAAAGAPALMQPLIAALEVNGWHLGSFPGSDAMRLGLVAAGEALRVAQREAGARTFALRQLLHPVLWRLLLPVARRVLPFDLEAHLHYHFTKVGEQTRLMLDTYIRVGQRHGLSVQALQTLRAALPALD